MNVATQGAPIKVGFSFAKPLAKKKRDSPESGIDYVTDISGGNIRSLAGNKREGPLIIPLSDQGVKKPKTARNEESVASSSQTIFITTQAPPAQPTNDSEKTIDQLAAEAIIRDAKNNTLNIPESNMVILPVIMQNQIEGIENITDEDERFKFDVNSRPDEADEEAYENTPIEEFGKAMLRGMGWEVGKPVGLNNRGLAEPIEFVARQGRLGLGATPETVEIKKKYIKPGETRGPKPIMVAPTGPDGKVRHVKGISEKLVPMKKGIIGRLAAVTAGPHEGLYARVIQELAGDEVAVRLLASDEEVVVAKSDLNLTVSESSLPEGHPALKHLGKEGNGHTSKSKSKDENGHKSKSKHSKSKSEDSSSQSSAPTWLHPHITVRMVSKSFENGKYYNKKGRIVDVVGRHECIVQLANAALVEGVKQKGLETVIPKPGGKVMIVAGSRKGSLGTLLERKKNKKDVECAVVQLSSDLSIDQFELDDIAEYSGGDYMDM